MNKYEPDQRTKDQIDRVFTYHAPKADQQARYTALREQACVLAISIAEMTPPGREQSLALTHLEECVMFANAAIARGES